MKNDGTIPPYERVDIKQRCGWITRDVDPTKYRWASRGREEAGDITDWNPIGPRKEICDELS